MPAIVIDFCLLFCNGKFVQRSFTYRTHLLLRICLKACQCDNRRRFLSLLIIFFFFFVTDFFNPFLKRPILSFVCHRYFCFYFFLFILEES